MPIKIKDADGSSQMVLSLGDVFTEGAGAKTSAQSLSVVPASDYVPPLSVDQAKDSTMQLLAKESTAQMLGKEITLATLLSVQESILDALGVLVSRAGIANGLGQVRISIEQGSVGIASNQTLTTLSTLNNAIFFNAISTEGVGRMGYNQPAITMIASGITVSA